MAALLEQGSGGWSRPCGGACQAAWAPGHSLHRLAAALPARSCSWPCTRVALGAHTLGRTPPGSGSGGRVEVGVTQRQHAANKALPSALLGAAACTLHAGKCATADGQGRAELGPHLGCTAQSRDSVRSQADAVCAHVGDVTCRGTGQQAGFGARPFSTAFLPHKRICPGP